MLRVLVEKNYANKLLIKSRVATPTELRYAHLLFWVDLSQVVVFSGKGSIPAILCTAVYFLVRKAGKDKRGLVCSHPWGITEASLPWGRARVVL